VSAARRDTAPSLCCALNIFQGLGLIVLVVAPEMFVVDPAQISDFPSPVIALALALSHHPSTIASPSPKLGFKSS